jgi:SAM-dependent methyltransferase
MKPPAFKDHFSAHAAEYARYRPRYPDVLFEYLASLCPANEVAWDCATGNGQAAHGLAAHFARVVATDASADQIANAAPHARVAYHVATAAASPLAARAADLVTVAQALHWLDLDAFYAEVKRVLKPGGVLAVWAYGLLQIDPAVDAVVKRFYEEVVGPYWPLERRLVEDRYQSLPFPFEEIELPAFSMSLAWSLDDLYGYLGTWSATRRFMKTHGANPTDQIADALAEAWGDPDETKLAEWGLPLRVGHV